ncbi:MAG: PadR family transcriptional regulator [Ktedonobacteraceae bacterium]|nr:PadR family transcriptional regulator [Ktedonobacteraceae bacterium]
MAKRKVSNMLALAVLSLLTERPMHPYEISSVMQMRQLSTVIKLNNSSLYSVMEALQREELIVPVETQREGRYPERTIYATTDAGRRELFDWLRMLLRKPVTEYTQFAAGLAFLSHLPPAEVTTLLEEQARYVREEISSIRAIIEKADHLGVDRLFLIEDRYSLTLLEARLTFVQQLIQEINDGTLTEMRDEQRIWKVTRPELASLGSDLEKGHDKTDDNPIRNDATSSR